MVKFINNSFGTEMWVAEDRVDEYKAAGHKPVAESAPVPTKEEPKESKTVKKTVKKVVKKG